MTNDEKFLENITIGLIKIRHEVEKLDMENARLREALKVYADLEYWGTENARLREALRRIASRCQNCDEGDEHASCSCLSEPFADQIARSALEGKE